MQILDQPTNKKKINLSEFGSEAGFADSLASTSLLSSPLWAGIYDIREGFFLGGKREWGQIDHTICSCLCHSTNWNGLPVAKIACNVRPWRMDSCMEGGKK